MRRMIVSLFAVALVVATAIPTMAATDVGNNKTTTVANGVTIVSNNNKGTKEVTVTVAKDADLGVLTVYYGNAKPQAGKTFDTATATKWRVSVPNGGVSYDWEPAPLVCEHEWVETHTATCVKGGWFFMVCNLCGEVDESSCVYEDALGHDMEYDCEFVPLYDVVDAWYAGYEAYKLTSLKCTRCGHVDNAREWVITVVDPNCTLDGYTEFRHDPTGGKWYYDYTPALGHTWESIVWDGYGYLALCSVCGWQGYINDGDFTSITVTQTVIGGSYNFAPVPLLGPGYTYDVIRGEGLAMVAKPDAWAYPNQFVFNQAAGASVSRAGEYVITAADADGVVVEAFKITVK